MNYPDDIGQYNWHPDSPFYTPPKEEEEEEKPDGSIDDYVDSGVTDLVFVS